MFAWTKFKYVLTTSGKNGTLIKLQNKYNAKIEEEIWVWIQKWEEKNKGRENTGPLGFLLLRPPFRITMTEQPNNRPFKVSCFVDYSSGFWYVHAPKLKFSVFVEWWSLKFKYELQEWNKKVYGNVFSRDRSLIKKMNFLNHQ